MVVNENGLNLGVTRNRGRLNLIVHVSEVANHSYSLELAHMIVR